MKEKILNYIYSKYESFFREKVLKSLKNDDFEKLYTSNSHAFDLLALKEFVGYIPKDVREPILKVFEEHGEAWERWTLFQSWYLNKKMMADPAKQLLYYGMLIYIKQIHTMASVHKKTYIKPPANTDEEEVDVPWIDKVLADVQHYKDNFKKKDEINKGDQADQAEASKDA